MAMSREDVEKMLDQYIVNWVWREKYQFKNPDGSSAEKNMAESLTRVVYGVYRGEEQGHIDAAMNAVLSRRFSPGGRHHAAMGTGLASTALNCFVMPTIQDSMRTHDSNDISLGIMDNLALSAYTQQMGGGIGMDFSTIRPKGALVAKRAAPASGPLHFMDMWDSMCKTIMAAGARRGAMMATMRCDHPDIEEFIDAKHDPNRLRNFNVSIMVTDAFMKAVEDDSHWYLLSPVPPFQGNPLGVVEGVGGEKLYAYKQVQARDLWQKIMRSTYDEAEPGIIFIDTVNRMNNLHYHEMISATNPCGEQPLGPGHNCNLGAINLAVMVDRPFSPNAKIDYQAIINTTVVAMRWLDNIIDRSLYPSKMQEEIGKSVRRTGLGITGLHNMLMQLGLRYGSSKACEVTGEVMRTIRDTAYLTSIDLASTRGSFPAFDRDQYLKGEFIKKLPDRIRHGIAEQGIRNSVLLTIAPTGTTSLYYGNVSSGLEPTFALSYGRKTLNVDGSYTDHVVEDFGFRLWKKVGGYVPDAIIGEGVLPEYMDTAQKLGVDDHLAMQAVCQRYIDSAVSKTINVPTDYPFEDFEQCYFKAWRMGLKGCTTYRPNPNSGRGSVLSVEKSKDISVEPLKEEDRVGFQSNDITFTAAKSGTIEAMVIYRREDSKPAPSARDEVPIVPIEQASRIEAVRPRSEVLAGKTYKIKWPADDHAYYVTINDDEHGDPFEIFINSKNVRSQEWIAALTRCISAIFRRGGDITFLIDELEQVYSATGEGYWIAGKHRPSLVAVLGNTLRVHLGLQEPKVEEAPEAEADAGMLVAFADLKKPAPASIPAGLPPCPKCHAPALQHQEGCSMCLNCGHSDCS